MTLAPYTTFQLPDVQMLGGLKETVRRGGVKTVALPGLPLDEVFGRILEGRYPEGLKD